MTNLCNLLKEVLNQTFNIVRIPIQMLHRHPVKAQRHPVKVHRHLVKAHRHLTPNHRLATTLAQLPS